MFKKPHVCGKTKTFIPSICSDSAYFVGTADTTIPQGSDFDLTAGVKAYDSAGVQLPFTTTPLSIDTCTVGTHSVVYTAEGVSDTRTITVVATGNPSISGLTPILNVKVGDTVNTMQDVSATDVNGNTIPVVCTEGTSVTYSQAGTFTLHYTATDKCGKVATGTRTVTVESGSIVCTDKVCEMVVSCDEPTPPTPTQRYTVTLHAGTGGTVNGGGTFDSGTQITVRASANSGYTFSNWRKGSASGTSVSSSSSYTFTVSGNVDLYAVFSKDTPTPTSHTVQLRVVTNGDTDDYSGGEVSGAGTFTEGTQVTVRASANNGYEFSNWADNTGGTPILSSNTSYTFTVTKDTILYAFFEEESPTPTTYTVTTHPVTDGTVDKDKGGTTSGDGSYTSGSSVTVKATAESGYTFKGWSEYSSGSPIVSTSASYTFTVSKSTVLYAIFEENAPTTHTVWLGITTNGEAGDEHGGDVYGAGTYTHGSSVTVRASANSGYEFTNWSKQRNGYPVESYSSSYTFTIMEDVDLWAIFDSEPTPTQTTESFGTEVRAGDTGTVTLSHTPASGTSISMSTTHYGSNTLSFTAGTASNGSVGDFIISYNGGSTFDIDGSDVDEETVTQALTINSVSYYY